MIELPNVSLICVSCIQIPLSLDAIRYSITQINFGEVKLLTSVDVKQPPEIQVVPIPHIASKPAYSYFIMNNLHKYIGTEFVLIVQWDGHIINPHAWTNNFLNYDYIGAIWGFYDEGDMRVGNGGFSLRSKKLMRFLATNEEITQFHPEDSMTCRIYRKLLEDNGFKYAPEEIADEFSVEGKIYGDQFGWHGGSRPRSI